MFVLFNPPDAPFQEAKVTSARIFRASRRFNDGNKRHDAATIETVQDVYRVDLESRKTQARYVRVERVPAAKPTAADFEFRNVLIYGRKL